MAPTPVHPLIRFREKAVVDPGGCWLWTGATSSTGYGNFWMDRRYVGAHRAAYLMFRGPVPEGLELDHLCRVRRCVNPFHLEAVTRQINTLRGTGPSAENATKTHCKRGHELAGDNLYVTRPGTRTCKACKAQKIREFEARNPDRKHKYRKTA
jgi:hypothetical protein